MRTKETLTYMIEILLYYLEELEAAEDTPSQQFRYGEKTAYTECLEILQMWKKSDKYGLDFIIEAKYPL